MTNRLRALPAAFVLALSALRRGGRRRTAARQLRRPGAPARRRRPADLARTEPGSPTPSRRRTRRRTRTDSDIWMTSWDGQQSVRLTTEQGLGDRRPAGARTASTSAFLSDRNDENDADQLWLLPRAGGEAEKITDFKGGVERLRLVARREAARARRRGRRPGCGRRRQGGRRRRRRPSRSSSTASSSRRT